MKVLFITHSFPRAPGDVPGSFVLNLAVALRGEGVEVRVVAPSADALPATDVIEGIPVERFRYAPRRFENLAYTGNMAAEVRGSWSAKLALVGFLGAEFGSAVRSRRSFEPDLVHAHWWFPGGLVGTWVAAMGDVPLVTTLHGSDVRLAKGVSIGRALFRRVLQQSRAVTAVSRWLADETRTIARHTDVQVAPMPVSTDLFTPSTARDPNRLLFVGRLNRQKGPEYLVRALPRLRTAVVVDIVGEGPDGDALQEIAGALGVSDRIRWHGALTRTQLRDMYQRATAVVMPSTGEGLGLVAVEALLCETPVIAFDSGGLTDVVHHDQTGLLVPPGDVPALAAAIDALLERPDGGRALGQAGRMVALASFAPESVARRYSRIYQAALGPRGAT